MFNDYRDIILENRGFEYLVWLEELPHLIALKASEWHLADLTPVSNISYNYVAFAKHLPSFKDVILKISPDPLEITREIQALTLFPQKIRVDIIYNDASAYVMNRIKPGFNLAKFYPNCEEESLKIFCSLSQQIHSLQSVFNNYSSLENTLFSNLSDLNPYDPLTKECQKIAGNLQKTTSASDLTVLHGDLHHFNILFDQKDNLWKMIDPKGIKGERVYEGVAYLRNPWPNIFESPSLYDLLENRCIMISQLWDVDIDRLKKWSFVHAILSSYWCEHNEKEKDRNRQFAYCIQSLF